MTDDRSSSTDALPDDGAVTTASRVRARGCVSNDVIGVAGPILLLAAIGVVVSVVVLLIADVESAVRGGLVVVVYGAVGLVWVYVPYLAGYLAFRIVGWAWSSSIAAWIAGSALAASFVTAILLTMADAANAAVVLVFLGAVPSLGGLVSAAVEGA
jgi:hypothetical protein